MIMNGSRRPGQNVTDKLINYFSFTENEAEYFRDLIRLDRIKDDPSLAVLLMEKMGKNHPNGKFELIDPCSFEVISNWHAYAIRELVLLENFVNDPEWISEKLAFKVSPLEVKKAIVNLLEVGLLQLDNKNQLVQQKGKVSTSDDIASEALKRFHEGNLDNAKKAIRLFSIDERYIGGTVFAITKSKIGKAKKVIRRFEEEMLHLFESDSTNADEVVCLNIQLFPLTNINKTEEKK